MHFAKFLVIIVAKKSMVTSGLKKQMDGRVSFQRLGEYFRGIHPARSQ